MRMESIPKPNFYWICKKYHENSMLLSYKEINHSHHITPYGLFFFFLFQKKVSGGCKDISLLSSVPLHNWVVMIFWGTCYPLNKADTLICLPFFTHNFTHRYTHPKEQPFYQTIIILILQLNWNIKRLNMGISCFKFRNINKRNLRKSEVVSPSCSSQWAEIGNSRVQFN